MRELSNLPRAGRDYTPDSVFSRTTCCLVVRCSLKLWATLKEVVLRSWRGSLPPGLLPLSHGVRVPVGVLGQSRAGRVG